MSPTRIMIIRHAEKPVPDRAPGFTADGSPDLRSLSETGWERARRLVGFFAQPSARHIERPDVVFAAAADEGSKRPAQTVIPLAQALWPESGPQPFNATIAKDDAQALADAVMRESGVVLVCWEHKAIPGAVAALPNAPATPEAWPGDRFDVVWILKRKPDGWEFRQTPQMLMPGDQNAVIPFARRADP
ncbi:hypothetical protein DFR50_12562 [Roseiarcus fermentans]|uniref:Broad specificity phosphatase PhoE n=1 Tax=Roseiarcus fermentans TaxID=1473586 RepID=A0A366F3L7_9HYPH|nr:histidine phosphatase family protein [Roseiarcus fermentans]RBP08580.1 hypothetical protein DFR50_12562 [Roseiarcus fermentans]